MLGLQNYLIVGLGGFLGAVARFWVAEYVAQRMGTRFPYGTFVINCSGSFAIGVVMTVLDHYAHWTPNWRYLLPIGFIGAYTTFSTFEFETLQSMQQGQFALAAANLALSVVLGFACVYAGVVTGKSVVRITASARPETNIHAGALSKRAPDFDTSESAELLSAD
jgi:CrcB protein